jgi:hypothetical protein
VNDIATMDHKEASGTLRQLEYHDEGSPTERLALAERALETSPEQWAFIWRKRVEIYESGRWVRVKRTQVTVEDFGSAEGE